ncbi:hypothetical protein BGZ54_009504 [Gamsiella multidivaricata]|nr:hypothetical protein BGZ54_009504 [Gamsiella multidivaricata]
MHEKGTLLGKHPQTPSPCEERSTRTKGFKSLSSGMKAPFSPILPPNFGTPPGTPSRADSFDLFTSVPQSPIASPFGLGRSDDNPFLGSTSRRPRFEMDYLSESQWYSDYPHHLTKEYLEELFNLDKRVMFTETKSGSRNYPDYLKSNFYVSETLLGKGDFADVLKVQNKHNKEFYAVKRLVRTVQGAMERKRYLNEVRNMWRVEKCPNVLQLLEAWEQRGKIYMKMELCRLGSLKSALLAQKKYGGFNERRAWRCLADLASGLRAIHDSNIIHLDIKPENVFITAAGSLKIGDFGLSITYPVETKDVTEGDKYYMAQELLNGECGKHSDIFSLGMTLYEMVTNQVDDLPGEGRLWHRLRDGDFDMKEYMTEDIVSLPPSSSDDTSGKDQQAATSTSLPAATGTTPHTTIKIFGYHKLFSKELLDLIKKMMQPTYEQRPTAAAILKTPRVHEILAKHSENGSKGVRTDEAMSGLLLQSI